MSVVKRMRMNRLGVSLLALALAGAPKLSQAANIAVFGDSLADGAWIGLHQELSQHAGDKLFRDSKVGTGLTRPDIKGFTQNFIDSLSRDHVDTAVIMFGANDQQSLRDETGKGYLFQSPGWVKVYTDRIGQILAACKTHNVRVIWVGLPVLRDESLNKGAQYLNGLIEAAVKQGGGTYLPLAGDFRDKDGAFASHLPDTKGELREVRLQDGVHFTFYGYDLIGKKIYGLLDSAVSPHPLPAPVPAAAEAPAGKAAPAGAVPQGSAAATPAVSSPAASTPPTVVRAAGSNQDFDSALAELTKVASSSKP